MSRLVSGAPFIFLGFLAGFLMYAGKTYPDAPFNLLLTWTATVSLPALAITTLIMVLGIRRDQPEQTVEEENETYSSEETNPFLTSARETTEEPLDTSTNPKDFLTNVSIRQLQREDRLKVTLKKPVNIHVKGKNQKEVEDFDLIVEMKEPSEQPTEKTKTAKPSQTEKPTPQIFEKIEERG